MSNRATNSAIILLLLSIFADSAGWGISFPIFDAILLKNTTHLLPLTMSFFDKNLLFQITISLYCVCMFLSSPVLGQISDIYNRKLVLVLSLLGAGAGFSLTIFAIIINKFSLLLIGQVIAGLTAGNIGASQAALVDLSTPATLQNNMRLNTIAGGFGFAVGPTIGGILMKSNWPGIFPYILPLIIIAALLFAVAVLVQVFYEPPASHGSISWFLGVSQLNLKSYAPKIKIFLAVLLFLMIARTIFFSSIPAVLTARFSSSSSYVAWVIGYFGFIFMFSIVFVFPWIEKTFELIKIIKISILLQLLGFIAFLVFSMLSVVWVSVGVIAFTTPFIFVALVSLLSLHTKEDQQGKIMGVVGSIAALAWGLGPLIGAGLMHFGILLVCITCISLLAFAWTLLL